MRCILCKGADGPFTTVEHSVPESLGGGHWSELPPGLVCDSCQNYFGTKVECRALGDHPFLLLRTLLALPTKKGRAPWLDHSFEGKLESAGTPGRLYYAPAPHIRSPSEKSVMRFIAHPKEPRAVCRFLLKMGIEAIAFDTPDDALHERFDAARAVARGKSNAKWWYLECDEMTSAAEWFSGRQSEGESLVELSVATPAPGIEAVVFKIGPVTMIAPLLPNIHPDVAQAYEDHWRLVWS
jgi:hypothetical protein